MPIKLPDLKPYFINPFVNFRMLDPLSKRLTKQQRVTCVVSLIVTGILTGPLFYIGLRIAYAIKLEIERFRPVKRGDKTVHVRPVKVWKEFKNILNPPDLSYVRPKVDITGMKNLSEAMKKQIKTHCINMMRASMGSIDRSITDAVHEVIKREDHAELLQTVNTFTSRVLDIYEAYVKVQLKKK